MKSYLSIPNLLTYSRIFVALFFVAAVFWDFPFVLLLIAFLSIFVSDKLDGYLARRWDQTSVFGERLETVADTSFTIAFILFALVRLELPLILPLIFLLLLVIGLIGQMATLKKTRHWFSQSLWPSKISALISYLAGLSYLVDIPAKFYSALLAIGVAIFATAYHLFRLHKFMKK